MKLNAKLSVGLMVMAGLGMMVGCEEKKPAAPVSTPAAAAAGHDHDHDHDHGHSHGGEKAVVLGTTTIGDFLAIAARGEAKFEAGKEAAVTVSVSAAPGKTASAKAVRFWVGAQDAKGSVKAKGEIADAKKAPNDWHQHADVPKPLPEGAKLWVEIEDEKGAPSTGSFDLK
jgi:hypothetical protein